MVAKVKMTVQEVLAELEGMGDENTRKIYTSHGASGSYYGVKIADLKTIVKKVKKDHDLAVELFKVANADAQYLAALIADAKAVTPDQLNAWAKAANWYWVSEFPLAGVAAESPHGWVMGQQWIDSDLDNISSAGWATLANVASLRADEELDLEGLKALLDRVVERIEDAPNRTRYTMNGFVISVGCYVLDLLEPARKAAKAIGKVSVDMGKTACKVPLATERIEKVVNGTRYGKKRKNAR